jgi:site-specific DNA-methyltransferase (adenine-specific)
MGSGSTGCGAILEGFKFIGVELSEEYLAIARGRIKAAQNERNRRKQYDLFMTGAQP